MGVDTINLTQLGKVADSCEHGTTSSGRIKGGELLCLLLKEDRSMQIR
jgi:hypothetical protein